MGTRIEDLLTERQVEALAEIGIGTVEELAAAEVEAVMFAKGFGQAGAEKIIARAKEALLQDDGPDDASELARATAAFVGEPILYKMVGSDVPRPGTIVEVLDLDGLVSLNVDTPPSGPARIARRHVGRATHWDGHDLKDGQWCRLRDWRERYEDDDD